MSKQEKGASKASKRCEQELQAGGSSRGKQKQARGFSTRHARKANNRDKQGRQAGEANLLVDQHVPLFLQLL
jgi:uncharacterized protein YdaU (DUF1376 family)